MKFSGCFVQYCRCRLSDKLCNQKGRWSNEEFWKRLGSAGVATALCLGMAQAVPAAVVSAADPLFSAECEDLTLSGDAQVATKSL